MTPIEQLLSRLHGVRRTGRQTWVALCPTRNERTPSLAVRDLDDGRVLMHDFGGAKVDDIVASIGLTLADLFPARPSAPCGGTSAHRRPFSSTELIDLAADECRVAVVIASDIIACRPEPDLGRLIQAAARMSDIAEVVHGKR